MTNNTLPENVEDWKNLIIKTVEEKGGEADKMDVLMGRLWERYNSRHSNIADPHMDAIAELKDEDKAKLEDGKFTLVR